MPPLSIAIATPSPRGSTHGNRITALRWARRLRELGARVWIAGEADRGTPDLLIALHAYRSAPTIHAWRSRLPHLPVITILTGTDIYGEFAAREETAEILRLSDRLVVLQPLAKTKLAPSLHFKTRVVRQSARAPRTRQAPAQDAFEVVCVSHLREVKDPLLPARAVRLLPPTSRLRLVHLGGAHDATWLRAAERESQENPRYVSIGEVKHAIALDWIARARVFILSSKSEGSPSAMLEAIACGVPVLSTRIDGAVGTLGRRHPGLYTVGSAPELAQLLTRCETDAHFLMRLAARSVRLQRFVTPEREREALRELIRELQP